MKREEREKLEAKKMYVIADVMDLVREGDPAVLADVARTYPALLVGLMVDSLSVARTLVGHKRAWVAERKMRGVYFYARTLDVAEAEGAEEADEPERAEPERDETSRLLQIIRAETGEAE